jgi:hypothetical protein
MLRIEELESRFLFSAGGLDSIFALPDRGGHGVTSPTPVGYTPAQIRHAYGFDQITFSNGVKGDGSGQTIAIVDAYDDPNIFKDLDVFDVTFGLPGPAGGVLTKVTPQGHTKVNSSWAGEISLDVEWAHAMAPGAHILLVETRSSNLGDLLAGVSYANSQTGVVAVSMSWGGGEFSSESSFDSFFTTPGITYTAASGDSPGASWPSSSPNVISVGGTTLPLDAAGDYPTGNETGWSNSIYGSSGGGTSSYESLPSYQASVTGTTRRATPDVAFDADPVTGVAIYDTVAQFGQTGWFQTGGTSLGAPAWAALVAIADQGRGAGASLSSTQTLTALYSNSSDLHDITSGTSGSNSAHAGFNLVTGLGTPIAQQVVQHLVSAPALRTAAVQSSGTANSNTPPVSTRPIRPADTIAPAIFLFLGTQPQVNYGSVTVSTPVSVALPVTAPAVFVPHSFTTASSSSGSGGFGSGDDSAIGLGPVIPGPAAQQVPDSSPGQTGSRVKPEKAPGDYPATSPESPQQNRVPTTPDKAAPDDKQEQAPNDKKDAPGDGFWNGDWTVDGATLAANDDATSEPLTESAALIPGLVAFLSGSWGIQLVDSTKKSEIRNTKSEKNSER